MELRVAELPVGSSHKMMVHTPRKPRRIAPATIRNDLVDLYNFGKAFEPTPAATSAVFFRAVEFWRECLDIKNNTIHWIFTPYSEERAELGLGLIVPYKNKTFDITILGTSDKRTITDAFVTIAHELVHAKQYVHDNLYEHVKENNALPLDKKLPYFETWWEKEAYTKEKILVELFVKDVKSRSSLYK